MKKSFVIGFIVSLLLLFVMAGRGALLMRTREDIEDNSVAVDAYVIETPQNVPYFKEAGLMTFKVKYKYTFDGVEYEYMNDNYCVYHAVDNGTPQTLYVDPNTKLVVLDASSKDGETAAFVIAGGFFANIFFQLVAGLVVDCTDKRKIATVIKYIGMGVCALLTCIGLAIIFMPLKVYFISACGTLVMILFSLFLIEIFE